MLYTVILTRPWTLGICVQQQCYVGVFILEDLPDSEAKTMQSVNVSLKPVAG